MNGWRNHEDDSSDSGTSGEAATTSRTKNSVILDAFGDEDSTAISDPERFLLLPLLCGDAAVLSEELDFDFAGLVDVFFNSSTSTASSARYVSGRK